MLKPFLWIESPPYEQIPIDILVSSSAKGPTNVHELTLFPEAFAASKWGHSTFASYLCRSLTLTIGRHPKFFPHQAHDLRCAHIVVLFCLSSAHLTVLFKLIILQGSAYECQQREHRSSRL